MFKFSAIGIQHNMCLLPVQGLFFLLAALLKICLLAMFIAFVFAYEVKPDPSDAYGIYPCSADVQNDRKPYYVFFCITFGWFAFWVSPFFWRVILALVTETARFD